MYFQGFNFVKKKIKFLKIREFYIKNPQKFVLLFLNVNKKNMFTI